MDSLPSKPTPTSDALQSLENPAPSILLRGPQNAFNGRWAKPLITDSKRMMEVSTNLDLSFSMYICTCKGSLGTSWSLQIHKAVYAFYRQLIWKFIDRFPLLRMFHAAWAVGHTLLSSLEDFLIGAGAILAVRNSKIASLVVGENQWKPLKITENRWKPLKTAGNRWKLLETAGNCWKPLETRENHVSLLQRGCCCHYGLSRLKKLSIFAAQRISTRNNVVQL